METDRNKAAESGSSSSVLFAFEVDEHCYTVKDRDGVLRMIMLRGIDDQWRMHRLDTAEAFDRDQYRHDLLERNGVPTSNILYEERRCAGTRRQRPSARISTSVTTMENEKQNGAALPSHDLLSLGLSVEDAAKELLVHAMEFRDDWRKGDFTLPSLAQCDMESMETKFEPLWDALKAVANYRLRNRINLRDNAKGETPI